MSNDDLGYLTDGIYRIEALRRQAAEGIENEKHRKGGACDLLISQQPLAVIREAAHQLVVLLFFEYLCQNTLGIGRSHSKECTDPHPEKSTRATRSYRTGYTEDVARADSHCRRKAECRKGRNAVGAGAIFQHCSYRSSEVCDLDKSEPEGEENTRTYQQNDSKGEISQNGNICIPCKVCGKIPKKIGYRCDK